MAPSLAGRGVGSALLAAAERIIAESAATPGGDDGPGAAVASVHVLKANRRACDFYARRGWEEVGEITSKIEGNFKRPGALHPVLLSHPWVQLRFEKPVEAPGAPSTLGLAPSSTDAEAQV